MSMALAATLVGIAHLCAEPRVELPSVQSLMVAMPHPEYPVEARAKHLTGHGVYDVIVRTETGVVTRVVILRSSGSSLLDDAAVKALSRWRAKPGKMSHIKVPVNFVM
jgi:periplasmic protein TonB